MGPLNVADSAVPVQIQVRMLVYQADQVELLDFEKKAVSEDSLTIRNPKVVANGANGVREARVRPSDIYIIQNGRKMHPIANPAEVSAYLDRYPNALVIARIVWSEKGCFVCSSELPNVPTAGEECYRVVSKHLQGHTFSFHLGSKRGRVAVNEGDRLRFGRSTLVVRYLARHSTNSLTYLHGLMSQDQSTEQRTEGSAVEQADATAGGSPAECGEAQVVRAVDACPIGCSVESTARDRADDAAAQAELEDTAGAATPATAAGEPEQKMCRICLEDEELGPLIIPCKCKGSMGYVHLECIRTWVQGRLKVKDGEGKSQFSYFLRNLRCELCGVPYPSYVDVDSVMTEFLGIEEPAAPYVVLEPEGGGQSGLYVSSVVKRPISIGRSSDSDVLLHDISASRLHAVMYYRDGHFFLEDEHSKFGTLLHVGKSFSLPVGDGCPVVLRFGTAVLSIEAKPERRLPRFCCFGASRNLVRSPV
ncbi:FHA domain protein, putative [Babesia caballi]|uniref:FHA domain protein, putative n=1 Tax=Babesia caballi TaxID=5871 RepID=A0AAV4LXX3_BABCB|nr:FHA domain protein, putative [Babesia caballi]